MVLVETQLDRGADDDLDEAKSAIERLAALAGNAGAVDNVIVLRLWAQMARALGDEAAYRDYRDRYQAMATALGLEGHMKWAEAMPWQARSTSTDRNRPQWRLAELRLREPVYDRAGCADVAGRSVSVVRFCEGVRSGGCSFGGGDVSVHRC